MSASRTLPGVVREIQAELSELRTDNELLTQYAHYRDESAFNALVRKHGSLVIGIARRNLRDQADVDDVFQATFLALARSADRLCRRRPLAIWLRTVARRQARKARFISERRHVRERAYRGSPTPARDPIDEITGRELLELIDEEIDRLPESQRAPLLLCCVEGLSREEAARELGSTEGAIKGSLERGRKRLADRLAKRGIALTGAMLASVARGVVPRRLVERTVSLARAPWAVSVPAPVNELIAGGSSSIVTRTLLLGALLAMGVGVFAVAPQPTRPAEHRVAPPVAKTDQSKDAKADALPNRVTLQLGSALYRHGTSISRLTVSRDGKLAVATSGNHYLGSVRGFDLSTGKVIYKIGRDFTFAEAVALSPDGKTLATKPGNEVHFFDAKTGKKLRTIKLPKANPRTITRWLTFSPDGRFLTTTSRGREVHLLNVQKGNLIRTFEHEKTVYSAAFSPDGKLLAAGGYDSDGGNYFIRLWDVATGNEIRRFFKGARGVRSVAFSPDGKTLAAGGDDAQLRLWDVASGKLHRTFAKSGYRIRSVAFSPDGHSIAACGDSIRVFDTTTGKERLRIARKALDVHFNPDGRILTAAVGGAIHRWDAASGRQLTPQGSESAIDRVLITPDGATVITLDQSGMVHVWNGRSGMHVRRIQGAWQRGLALSPDGRLLAIPVDDPELKFKDAANPRLTYEGSRIRLYDLKTARFLERFASFKGEAHRLTFTRDGRTLVGIDHRDGGVRLWDVKTGKMRSSFRAVREGERNRTYLVRNAVLSPDGNTLAVSYDRFDRTTLLYAAVVVRLWSTATGKEKHEFSGHQNGVAGMAFSPDGRVLVTCQENPYASNRGSISDRVFVWDVQKGARFKRPADGLGIGASHVAFSPDGRTLVTASADGKMRLWETATWSVRLEFSGHRDRVSALRFAADGRLFSGSLSTTVLAWDLQARKTKGDVTLDQAWNDLENRDAKVGFAAQGRLLIDPAESVKNLAARIKPAPVASPERLRQQINDLGSRQFKVRERATQELRKLGRAAEQALRDAVKTTKSAEVRQRATLLLNELERSVTPPSELCALRAIEVLERMTHPDAKRLLKTLSKGDPNAPVTQAALQALKRMN